VTVFTFQKMVTAEDGAQLPIVNRVTVDENGNIIKSTGNSIHPRLSEKLIIHKVHFASGK
jgi:hypothetical protein